MIDTGTANSILSSPPKPKSEYLVLSFARFLVDIAVSSRDETGGQVFPLPREIENLISSYLISSDSGSFYWTKNLKDTADKAYDIGISGAVHDNLDMVEYGLWGTFNLDRPKNFTKAQEYGYMVADYLWDVFDESLANKSLRVLDWVLKTSKEYNWSNTEMRNIERSAFYKLKCNIDKSNPYVLLTPEICNIFKSNGFTLPFFFGLPENYRYAMRKLYGLPDSSRTRKDFSNYIEYLETDRRPLKLSDFDGSTVVTWFTDDLFTKKNSNLDTETIYRLIAQIPLAFKLNRVNMVSYLIGILRVDEYKCKLIDTILDSIYLIEDGNITEKVYEFMTSFVRNHSEYAFKRATVSSMGQLDEIEKILESEEEGIGHVTVRQKVEMLDDEVDFILSTHLLSVFHSRSINRYEMELMDVTSKCDVTSDKLLGLNDVLSFIITPNFLRSVVNGKIKNLYKFVYESIRSDRTRRFKYDINDLSYEFLVETDFRDYDSYFGLKDCEDPDILEYLLEKERGQIDTDDDSEYLFCSIYSIIVKNIGVDRLDDDFVSILEGPHDDERKFKMSMMSLLFGSYDLYDLILESENIDLSERTDIMSHIMELPVRDLKELITKYSNRLSRLYHMASNNSQERRRVTINIQMAGFCFRDKTIFEVIPARCEFNLLSR